MNYVDPAGLRHNYRAILNGASVEANSANANGSAPQPTNIPYNPQTGGSENTHVNGWVGVPVGAGFLSTPGSAAILSATAQLAPVPDVDGVDPFTNFTLADQDSIEAGIQSSWSAMYHLVFVPRPGVDVRRDITIDLSAHFRFAGDSVLGPDGWRLIQTIPLSLLRPAQAEVTFTVPSPGTAAALLPLAAGARTRRRRVRV